MKISIITVAYNSGSTIGDTLRSVAVQTHPDIEHIVIDGASTDQTLAEVRRYGGHLRTIVSEPDKGIYDAMNKGLAMASGEFVGFLNADDMLAQPDTVERMAICAQDADLLYGDLVYVDPEQSDKVVRGWRSGAYDAAQLRFGWMPPHPTFYFRRSALPDMRFDLRYRIAADYDFMVRSLQHKGLRIAYLPQVMVRMRDGGASNRSLKAMLRKSREDLDVMRRHGLGGVLTLASKNIRKLPQFFGNK